MLVSSTILTRLPAVTHRTIHFLTVKVSLIDTRFQPVGLMDIYPLPPTGFNLSLHQLRLLDEARREALIFNI